MKMSAIDTEHAYFTGNGTYKAVNPFVSRVGDFTPFYIAIAICTVILSFLLILNIVCCCSRYSDYWLDRHTGNRWIVSIWSTTPHKQPPLDFTELENPYEHIQYVHSHPTEYQEVHKREELSTSYSHPIAPSHQYLDSHKRESEI